MDQLPLFWIIFSVVIIALPLIALIDILKASFKDSTTKLIWVLVVLFMPVLGALLYFVIAPKQRRGI